MKGLGIAAAALTAMLTFTSANAAMAPVVGNSSSGVQTVGILCGPGEHLHGLVCVPNHPHPVVVAPVVREKACPMGWHLGPDRVRCRRD